MRVKLPPSPFHLNMHSVVLDQNSTILPENHSTMTLDEKIESARKKKEEGDHIFTSGNFLRAYRRYFKRESEQEMNMIYWITMTQEMAWILVY